MRKLLCILTAVLVIGIAGCEFQCDKLFLDGFEADTLGNPPLLSPAGDPPNDSIALFGPSSAIEVIASPVTGTQAVALHRTAQGPLSAFECITVPGPHNSGKYSIAFQAYHRHIYIPPVMTVTVKSAAGERAFELLSNNGQFRLRSGSGEELLSVTYSVDVLHTVGITINFDTDRFSLDIDNTDVADDKPFLDPGFSDLERLRFEFNPAILEAFPGVYVVDNIMIFKITTS